MFFVKKETLSENYIVPQLVICEDKLVSQKLRHTHNISFFSLQPGRKCTSLANAACTNEPRRDAGEGAIEDMGRYILW